MLALLTRFGRSFTGWTKLVTHEGVTVLFPEHPMRACSTSESPWGTMYCTMYRGQWKDSTASSILTIRDYDSATLLEPDQLFSGWKEEFKRAMNEHHLPLVRVKEKLSVDKHHRCDLLYANREETQFTRVSLIAQGNRLIILFAVGMLQEVLTPACSESFRSLRP